MSDQAILNMFNDMISARVQLATKYENIVIAIPLGQGYGLAAAQRACGHVTDQENRDRG